MEEYISFMRQCEALGKNAALKGNSPVGAMVIKAHTIISKAEEAAHSKNDITCHAEIEAIRFAIKKLHTNDLSNCILVTTHEPCIMCAYALRFYKIKKIVYKYPVQYLGSITSDFALLVSNKVPSNWGNPPEIIWLI
ncbi:MAG: nucleoside deaminase [Chitinophagaceae bacterium]|nr:nucleoside deaminase [Chitinophagaceae bacterium]